jgi:hypothetical protein
MSNDLMDRTNLYLANNAAESGADELIRELQGEVAVLRSERALLKEHYQRKTHAANAFPHLLAALEAAADAMDQAEMGIDPDADRRLRQYVIQTEKMVRTALAIARGEVTP